MLCSDQRSRDISVGVNHESCWDVAAVMSCPVLRWGVTHAIRGRGMEGVVRGQADRD